MTNIKIPILSDKKDVKKFLDDLKAIINNVSIDSNDDLIDKDDDKPPLLFVFGKDINNRQVYIKLKIKGENNRRILCLSFHYAKHKMKFPYA